MSTRDYAARSLSQTLFDSSLQNVEIFTLLLILLGVHLNTTRKHTERTKYQMHTNQLKLVK